MHKPSGKEERTSGKQQRRAANAEKPTISKYKNKNKADNITIQTNRKTGLPFDK